MVNLNHSCFPAVCTGSPIPIPISRRRRSTTSRLQEKESEFAEDLAQRLGRSVVVCGMNCLRTNGRQVLFAEKLEKPASQGAKWDLHLLVLN